MQYTKMIEKIQRQCFYLFEKLQISKSERYFMSILSILLIVIGSFKIYTRHQRHIHDQAQWEAAKAKLIDLVEQQKIRHQREQDSLKQWLTEQALIPHENVLANKVSNQHFEEAKQINDNKAVRPININIATEQELTSIPGIGPSYAKRIIVYRKEKGKFESKEDLLKIKGIGVKKLEKLKAFISI